jgi:hypothetical protein
MAETHDLHLLESEENDIRWAANADAENARIKLVNQVTQLITENLRLKKAIRETLDDNAHLADGDVCTLIKLKRAAAWPNDPKLSHADGRAAPLAR